MKRGERKEKFSEDFLSSKEWIVLGLELWFWFRHSMTDRVGAYGGYGRSP